MCRGLHLEELLAETFGVDGEGTLWGWALGKYVFEIVVECFVFLFDDFFAPRSRAGEAAALRE